MALRIALDYTALGWVKPDLDQLFADARQHVESCDDYDSSADGFAMAEAARHLEQARGTLRMLELHAASIVAEQMHQLARAIGEASVAQRDVALRALHIATIQLPDYLERLLGGHRDVPIVLLPLLNELRIAHGEAALNPTSLQDPVMVEAFGTDGQAPTQDELEHAQGSLSGRNRSLLGSVSAMVNEDIQSIQDALDMLLRGSEHDVATLAPQIEVLDRVTVTLGMLGYEQVRDQLHQMRKDLVALVDAGGQASEDGLMGVASQLLHAQLALEEGSEDLHHDADAGAVDMRELVGVLAREAAANFTEVRHAMVAFVETRWDHQQLHDTSALLSDVGGALQMLELDDAVATVEALSAYIRRELIEPQRIPDARVLDTLADALSSQEYYLDALAEQREGREEILEITRNSLESLGYWPVPSTFDAEPELASEPASAPAATEPASDEAASAEPATAQALDVPAPSAAADAPDGQPYVGGFAAVGDEIDDEIREIFLEELTEEIGNLDELVPHWQQKPGDVERVRQIRRVFHTLKGSGRMSGALELGEFSWSIESALNRVIDGSRPASPAVVQLVEHAHAMLPAFLAALSGQASLSADAHGLVAVAERIAQGEDAVYEPAAAPAAPAQVAAPASAEAEPIDGATELPAPVDAVLLEILDAEVSGHLQTVDDWVAHAPFDGSVNEALMRAIHTMTGAFAMAEVPAIGDALAPAESMVKRMLAANHSADADTIEAVTDLASAVRATLAKLVADPPRVATYPQLASRLRSLRDALPEAPLMSLHDVHEADEDDVELSAQEEIQRIEAERLEAERLEAERLEAERVEAERLEAERLEAERLEAERLEAERLEAERLEAERLEAERLEAERVEAERLEAERLEAERLEAERLEAERLEAERLEAQRVEAERLEAERLEAERLEAERLEAERLEAERQEAERQEAERQEAERAEAIRVEAEQLQAQQLEQQRAEEEAIAAARLQALALEEQRIEAEQAEAQRAEALREEAERIEAERIEAERIEAERIEAERIEAERIEAERLEAERVEAERLEAERREQAEAERLQAEQQRLEAERQAARLAEIAALELERARSRMLREARRLEGLHLHDATVESQRVHELMLARQQQAQAQAEQARAEAERTADARAQHDALARQQALEAMLLDQERQSAESLAFEQADAERLEAEQRAAESRAAQRVSAALQRAHAEAADSVQEVKLAAAVLREEAQQAALRASEIADFIRIEEERLAQRRSKREHARALRRAARQIEAAQLEAKRLEREAAIATLREKEFADFVQMEEMRLQMAAAQAQLQAEADIEQARAAANRVIEDIRPLAEDELDLELVDMFVEEANDLLDHSDGMMAALANDMHDRKAMVGLQRDLHTLKGGARMAGLMGVGELGHAMETLLEAVVEQRTSIDADAVTLLQRSFDSLHGMVGAVEKRQEPASTDALVDALTRRAAGESVPMPAEAPAQAGDSSAAADQQASASSVTAPTFAADDSEDDIVVRGPQEQVRIRADLLDRLVNYAGEVAIYRARLEQQLSSFRGAMREMDQTNTRLHDQLRRLDIETEAQIIARYQREQDSADASFDPLELDRFSNLQQLSRGLGESAADLSSLQETLQDLTRQYETLLLQQSRVSSDLQEGLMRTRMVPFDGLLPRLRRVVRQAAADTGKQVQLQVEGAHGELDRSVLERMTAPLEHMLRNAVAHGLETPQARSDALKPSEGRITVSVRAEGSEVVLVVADDGVGIDRDAVRRRALERGLMSADADLPDAAVDSLILQPGFTTSESVSRVAGRGVGMDVVASQVRQLGGSIDIHTQRGVGTSFTLRLPQMLAVSQAVFVRIGETTFAVPIASVRGVGRIARDLLAQGAEHYQYAGEQFTLHDLGELLGQAPAQAEGHLQMPLLLIGAGHLRMAVAVDEVIGSREIVVKPVGPQVASISGVYGATVMGDGSVVVILDIAPLVRHRSVQPVVPEQVTAESERRDVPLVMVVDDSVTMRKVTSRVLERQGFEVVTARDGVDAIERMAEQVPDVMLLDIEMPRMDGYELATHMRAESRLRDVPIIMITSRSGDKHRERAFAIGVQRYLGKPYQEVELLRNVNELLREQGFVTESDDA